MGDRLSLYTRCPSRAGTMPPGSPGMGCGQSRYGRWVWRSPGCDGRQCTPATRMQIRALRPPGVPIARSGCRLAAAEIGQTSPCTSLLVSRSVLGAKGQLAPDRAFPATPWPNARWGFARYVYCKLGGRRRIGQTVRSGNTVCTPSPGVGRGQTPGVAMCPMPDGFRPSGAWSADRGQYHCML